jgi:hypothetical protein
MPPSFRDRLRRMPTHWKILLGAQLLFTASAMKWRRKEYLLEQEKSPEHSGVASPRSGDNSE